jgi:hypothetical protein
VKPSGPSSADWDLPDLRSRVDELVAKALSDEVDLDAIEPSPDIDETERVMVYVQGELGTLWGTSEAHWKTVTSMVLNELQRLDIMDSRDPAERLTGNRRWLADWLPEITADRQDDKESGGPG